jgi:hypothetical protein
MLQLARASGTRPSVKAVADFISLRRISTRPRLGARRHVDGEAGEVCWATWNSSKGELRSHDKLKHVPRRTHPALENGLFTSTENIALRSCARSLFPSCRRQITLAQTVSVEIKDRTTRLKRFQESFVGTSPYGLNELIAGELVGGHA